VRTLPPERAAADALLDAAEQAYREDPVALAALRGHRRRLEEPLRVALAGMVKAGKSTLLNAVIGDEIAPTDAGECTRVVTWYRYGATPRVTLVPVAGEPRSLPVRREGGRLALSLGTTPPEDVARLVVQWPAPALRQVTLIDTPGIGSLSAEVSERSTRFLLPEDVPSEADAIVYLLRHLHATDLQFLEAFHDRGTAVSGTVNALAVLSRADEIGSGRIDALLSARSVADRYRRDAGLRALALEVVPVAGLLAQSARTLRQSEFAALTDLAGLDRADRDRVLLSSDRFVRGHPGLRSSEDVRRGLLDRFGLFGIRLALVLLGNGVDDAPRLAAELARRSGLQVLLDLLGSQFQARAEQLKARNVVLGVRTLLDQRPCADAATVAAALERIAAGAHGLAELRLLAALRTGGAPLERKRAEEAERLVGGAGVSPGQRLGLAADASPEEVAAASAAALGRWRALAESPLLDRAAVDACRTVVRSCEGILADTAREAPLPTGSASR
jgi:Dynamin family